MSDYASTSSRPASPVGELPNIRNARPFRFNYDAGARKGPASVSETTEGRGGDYFASNAPIPALNTSETSLALGALPTEWSSTRHGFHAISTVVNNPHKRSAPPKAHSSLPTVPPADLPRVRRKDFDSYLRTVAPEWERFQQNSEQGRQGAAQVDGPSSSAYTLGTDDLPTTPRTPRIPPGRPLPPLESVPDVYFDPKFDIGNPITFNTVTGLGNLEVLDFSDPSTLAWSNPLLETLSHHADTIEQHLVREISVRSTSFFAALSNLQDLQSESEQCLDRISNLRGLLKQVDEKGAKKGLEIVRLESKLGNMEKVREGVKMVGGIVEMTGVARNLVTAGQWGEALDVIESLTVLWERDNVASINPNHPPAVSPPPRTSSLATVMESPPSSPAMPHPTTPKPALSVPLSSLQAFASLPSHLRTLTLEIASSLTSDVVSVLQADLIERIDFTGDSPLKPNGGIQMSLKDRLRPLLHSLVRTRGVSDATVIWKEVVMGEVRNVLKRRIPAFDLDDGDDPQMAEKTKVLRDMAHPSFMDLATLMYRSYLNCIEGLQSQSSTVLEVLEAIRLPQTPVDINGVREVLSDILSSAGELANESASKVLNIRSEQHTALELPNFYTLFNVSWDFVVKSEVICKRMIVALRGVIVSQAKTFLQAFHQTRLSLSAKLVEDEQWNPAEVLAPVQRMINLLIDASIHDPRELLLNAPPDPTSPLMPNSPPPSASPLLNGTAIHPSSPLPSPSPNRLSINGSPQARKASSTPGKHLKIEDRNYFAVSATLEVLLLLMDYLKVIMNLPMLTTDTMSRIIELLKAFNSRTCQVVLGAGAMRSAGLKNITAKHLALASQSLSIMISLIPYVRETFRRHLSQKQAVMLIEFDKLKRDYQEHQNEIHAKLIAIMGDRLTVHIRSLQAIKWDESPQHEGVNDYMELLVKETVTLHKVLSRYLPPSVVEYVMSQVFAAINHRLSEEYTKIELPSLEAKERLLADAKYLLQKLTGLKNVGAPTAMLEIVVSEKRVVRSVAAQLPPQGRPTSPLPPTSPTPPQPQQQQQQYAAHPQIPTAPMAASRFKTMLGRATSLKKPPMPPPAPTQPTLPSVPDVEKALPLPSPSVTPALAVTPSPPATDTVPATPPPPEPSAETHTQRPGTPVPAVTVPDHHGGASDSADPKENGNGGEDGPVPVDWNELSTAGHALNAGDSEGVAGELDGPPPPTPPKSEDGTSESLVQPSGLEAQDTGAHKEDALNGVGESGEESRTSEAVSPS
ncbi:Vps54-domain-containing protein [Cristinia sonorae]|uniref:Vps54-domain-containing protein n=1 Tax=Cristinia sonorae TaxID=1940300 RepID=A0A8K0XUC2_9AGAR|nr:Vps54-domain-containing protein [Cristinia sonorae]